MYRVRDSKKNLSKPNLAEKSSSLSLKCLLSNMSVWNILVWIPDVLPYKKCVFSEFLDLR